MPEESIEDLKKRLDGYEQDGPTKLYYALNRKMVEMADLLNKKDLTAIAIDDPKDKTFDRLKVIWNDSSSLATAVQALGAAIGVSGDEEKDTSSRRRRITPESMSNVLPD